MIGPDGAVAEGAVDLERLLKLRLVIARLGEMDRAKWWNTHGQLGRLGSMAVSRGLPRTHHFAQARSVFAVASQRCAELFDPPASWTLWRLPYEIEQHFEARWERWIDHAEDWAAVFAQIADLEGTDVMHGLRAIGLMQSMDDVNLDELKPSAGGRAAQLPRPFAGTDADITLLALGFARGRPGSLVVPYALAAI